MITPEAGCARARGQGQGAAGVRPVAGERRERGRGEEGERGREKKKEKEKMKKMGKKGKREIRGGKFGDDHGGVGHARRSRARVEREMERGLESGVGKGSGELGLRGFRNDLSSTMTEI